MEEYSVGAYVRQRRRELDLTQDELARRVGCAAITIRKIEAEDARPSVQIAERLAMALAIPLDQRAEFVRRARAIRTEPEELPTPPPALEEIGREDLSGRAIRGYALAEKIGSGGMGAIYRAIQPVVEREVAIKIILPNFANHPDFIRRFETEAQLVARLEHPHIVPLYDYWREPGVAYLVMRLLRGGSLQGLLKNGQLPLATVSRLLEQVCTALHTAHRMGVVHRDLKPANILLDEDENAYLADFGIAKNLGSPETSSQTEMGMMIGSPQYMSPEQIQSLTVSPQTDLYCLGVVLFEMLTGQIPFSGPTPFELIRQHLQTPMPPLAAHSPGLPAALDAVISRATAKTPEERYETALDLLTDFQQAVSGMMSQVPLILAAETSIRELVNPYKGLRAFAEADADDFFGRETLVQQLLARLSEGGELARFMAVIGPSGSGKSSVVKAGLVPALRRGGLLGSENWFYVSLLPGPHPFEELEAALLRVAVNPPPSLLEQLKDGKRGLCRAINRILPSDPQVELALVIDQFEELFTLVENENERALFLNGLLTACLEENSRVRVVITLRADFVDRPLRYVDFGELLQRRNELVLPLTPDEVERAILGPARRVGLKLESGLVSTIIREIGDQPGTLPLLQYALTELFEHRTGAVITREAYQAIGGVLGALGRRAEKVFASLEAVSRSLARQMFLRLVTLGEGSEDTRRRALQTELANLLVSLPGQAASQLLAEIIETLGKHRLLTFDRDLLTRGPTVEIAHEALLREWPRLRAWLAESRADVRQQRQLALAAAEWQAAGQEKSFLLVGARLEQFEAWASVSSVALTGDEQTFLQASLAARDERLAEERARQQRELDAERQTAARLRLRNRVITAIGVISILLAALAGVLGFNANRNAQQAEANFTRAEAQRLAAESINALNANASAEVVGLLSIRALRLQYSTQGDAALLHAAQLNYPEQLFTLPEPAWPLALSPDGLLLLFVGGESNLLYLLDSKTGQEIRRILLPAAPVRANFSRDSRLILVDGEDNSQRLWDTASGLETQKFDVAERTSTSVFSRDGALVFTGTASGQIIAWETATGQERQRWQLPVRVRAIAPESGLAVIYSFDIESPQLWDFKTGQMLHALPHQSNTTDIQLCAGGKQVVIGYFDGAATIWDTSTGALLQTLQGHQGAVRKVECSLDGQQVLTGSDDRTARLWSAETGQQVVLFREQAIVSLLALSPDGKHVFTLSGDGQGDTIRAWAIQPRLGLPVLPKHQGIVNGVTFSKNGKWLATSDDTGVYLWEASSGTLLRQFPVEDVINFGLEFSPDSRYLAAGEWHTGLVHIWDIQTGQEVRRLNGAGVDGINELAFSLDGRHLFGGAGTWAQGSQAALWDVQTGEVVLNIPFKNVSGFYGADYSPDGNFLLLAHDDGVARLWDTHSGILVREFGSSQGLLTTGKFSPDGKTILTAGFDRLARLWDIQTGKEIRQFAGHTDAISHAAFSGDGKYLATASYDGTLRLWDVSTGLELRRYTGHTAPVENVAFYPSGDLLVSGSDDGTARFWDVDYHTTLNYLCSRLLRDLTEAERQQYGITDQTPTCPIP